MMKLFRLLLLIIILFVCAVNFLSIESFVYAQSIEVNAPSLLSKVDLGFSPVAGSFEENSTFDVQIFLNTRNKSVNGVEVHVKFDPDKFFIVHPLIGTSIIGVWVQPPAFDNTRGTASYVGVIPDGITTSSGLVGTITFKAKKIGKALVSFDSNSVVLFNDGLGTKAVVNFGRAQFSVVPKAPQGVLIFSETHPIESDWYNNTSPVISWEKEKEVEGFSYIFDNKPFTIPENTIMTTETTKSFENLNDGLWYFHIKSIRKGIWGNTGHFLVRIDNTPPADFTPTTNYLLAATIFVERSLISFFTTDNLSGVDRYEVGVIDKNQSTVISPVFIETESPYQVPISKDSKLQVIVRAIDKAGNIRESSIDIERPFAILKFLKDNIVYVLLFIILIGFIAVVFHYLVGHHILRGLHKIRKILYGENYRSKDDEKSSSISSPIPIRISKEQFSRDTIPSLVYPKESPTSPIVPVPPIESLSLENFKQELSKNIDITKENLK